jgi:hypothetical protein
VNPLGHLKGPSPQSEAPLPLNWSESKAWMVATWSGLPKETPASVDFDSQMSQVGREDEG